MTNTIEQSEIAGLRLRLEEAEETIRAIHSGAVDAFVVEVPNGARIYTLETADRPYRLLVEEMQQGAITLSDDGTIAYPKLGYDPRFRIYTDPAAPSIRAMSADEAIAWINADKHRAAQLYLTMSNDKKTTEPEAFAMMASQGFEYTRTPMKVGNLFSFMARIGSIKTTPASGGTLRFRKIRLTLDSS